MGPLTGLPAPGFGSAAAAADSAAAAAAGETAVMIGDGAEAEGDQKLVCQVPGCGKDLSNLKDYHQRYRICDTHIKLPQVQSLAPYTIYFVLGLVQVTNTMHATQWMQHNASNVSERKGGAGLKARLTKQGMTAYNPFTEPRSWCVAWRAQTIKNCHLL
jgi:hypothetical protein